MLLVEIPIATTTTIVLMGMMQDLQYTQQHNYNEKTFINKCQTACNTVATTALVVSWNPLEATDSSKLWTTSTHKKN